MSRHSVHHPVPKAGRKLGHRKEQLGFRCVKAISDESHFVMPPLDRFIDTRGDFQAGRFALWAAIRPQVWGSVYALSRNSRKASRALCEWLERHLASDLKPATVIMLPKIEAV